MCYEWKETLSLNIPMHLTAYVCTTTILPWQVYGNDCAKYLKSYVHTCVCTALCFTFCILSAQHVNTHLNLRLMSDHLFSPFIRSIVLKVQISQCGTTLAIMSTKPNVLAHWAHQLRMTVRLLNHDRARKVMSSIFHGNAWNFNRYSTYIAPKLDGLSEDSKCQNTNSNHQK